MDEIYEWLGQWYLARSRKAELRARRFKKKAENFFLRIRGW